MNHKKLVPSLYLTLAVLSPAEAFEPQVTIRTTTEDFVITQLVVNCPPGPWGAAFQWDGEKNQLSEAILDRIAAIESPAGAKVNSRTSTRNYQTEADSISTVSKTSHKSGPGKALCELLQKNL